MAGLRRYRIKHVLHVVVPRLVEGRYAEVFSLPDRSRNGKSSVHEQKIFRFMDHGPGSSYNVKLRGVEELSHSDPS